MKQNAHFLPQIYFKTYKNALEAYEDSVFSERGYLVIELRCETHNNQFLRSEIFPKSMIIFINESLAKKRPTLRLLHKAPEWLQKHILDKASSELIRCFCDCAHNVLQGNVSLSHRHKQKLKAHKSKLRKLAVCKVALKKKQIIIQKGGFLPLLLSALAPVITSV